MKAIHLQNLTNTVQILHLATSTSVASPTLSRGRSALVTLSLRPSEQIDVGKTLGLTAQRAHDVVMKSPEVLTRLGKKQLRLLLDFDNVIPFDAQIRVPAEPVPAIISHVAVPAVMTLLEMPPTPGEALSKFDPEPAVPSTPVELAKPAPLQSLDSILGLSPEPVSAVPSSSETVNLRGRLKMMNKEMLVAYAAGLEPPMNLDMAMTKAAMIEMLVAAAP